MQLQRLLTALLLCCSATSVAAIDARGLVARDDTPPPSTTQASQTQSISGASSTAEPPATTRAANNATSLVPSMTFTTSMMTVAANNQTTANDPVPLPILPQIDPANAVAGVFLLISGLVYTFIAVQWSMVHNFFSVGFVGSLAVTCLIVFIENPGASAGLAAGYVIAALLTGVVMGGLSTPFAQLTEGIGCFLGGFCLSMWLLTVKDGGLIQNKAGKVIFVAGMTCGIGLLVFHSFTRRRALLACIPFSGATAIVLGIDCFTRAGLKEFWIYVWDINENLFPLNTNTYPVTRAIRVESACIIVLFFFGLVVNLKLWKLIRKKEVAADEVQRAQQDQLDEVEAAAGLRTEKSVANEKELWEQQYGGEKKGSVTVSEQSLKRSSTNSQPGEQRDTIELVEVDGDHYEDDPLSRVTRRVGQGAGITINVDDQESAYPSALKINNPRPSSEIFARAASPQIPERSAARNSVRSSRLSNGPSIIPLPFPNPSVDNSKKESTSRDTSRRASSESKRASRVSQSKSQSQDDLLSAMTSESEDSSLAVVHDDQDYFSFSQHSPPQSTHSTFSDKDKRESSLVEQSLDNTGKQGDDKDNEVVATNNNEVEEGKPSNATIPETGNPKEPLNEETPKEAHATDGDNKLSDKEEQDLAPKSSFLALTSAKPKSTVASTVDSEEKDTHQRSASVMSDRSSISLDALKLHTSPRVLKAYKQHKTFEWAKESTLAEMPPLEELQRPESPGVQYEVNEPEPPRKPIIEESSSEDDQSLDSTPLASTRNSFLVPKDGSLSKRNSDASSGESQPATMAQSLPNMARSSTAPTGGLSPGGSLGTVRRSSYNVSSPMLGQLCESPIEEEPEAEGSEEAKDASLPLPSKKATLLGERENKLKNRLSSVGFSTFSQSTPNVTLLAQASRLSLQPEGDAGTRSPPLNRDVVEDLDDIPLSERRKLLRNNTQTTTSTIQRPDPIRTSSNPMRSDSYQSLSRRTSDSAAIYASGTANHRLSQQNLNGAFNSHQPLRREDSLPTQDDRAAKLAEWRTSLQQDPKRASMTASSVEDHRALMLREKRMREHMQRQHSAAKEQFGAAMDQQMRAPDGMWLHAKRLSQLQAQTKMK
ncbi:hypothetical protein BT63DRAFT_56305 [Microthyrium microscopicum]|uniref:TM7S3/TM198-like domain-containing protein n=1 Tax=Microthyrium microscopicum TaxID=703497 RepID=A0A6A6U3W8_9PEZI|nr:hypothetical protein BT63DRAFT_56305 [Microthyrium microscopicum]